MTLLYNPRWRLAWCAGSVLAFTAIVGIDWLLRSAGGKTFMAPTTAALWLSVALGAILGALAALWERHLLHARRSHLLAFHRAPLGERLSWRLQKVNLLLSGWLVLALLILIGWCVFAGVFVLPALFAANAVQFAFNRRLAAEFSDELRQRIAA